MFTMQWGDVGDSFITLHESSDEHDRHAMSINPDDEPGVVVGENLPLLYTLDNLGDVSCLLLQPTEKSQEAPVQLHLVIALESSL